MLSKELRKKLCRSTAIALAVVTMATSTVPMMAAERPEDPGPPVRIETQQEQTSSQSEDAGQTESNQADQGNQKTDQETNGAEKTETDDTDKRETDDTDKRETDDTDKTETDDTDKRETDDTDKTETDDTDKTETDGTDKTETGDTDKTDTDGTDKTETDDTDKTETGGTDKTDADGTDKTSTDDTDTTNNTNPDNDKKDAEKKYDVEKVDNTKEVNPNEPKEEKTNLGEKLIKTTISQVFKYLGVPGVDVDKKGSVEKGIKNLVKKGISKAIKSIPYAGDFLNDIFQSMTADKDEDKVKNDPIINELKEIQKCIDKLGKDLIENDTKNYLQSRIKELNKLIETNKIDNDTAEYYLDSTLKQLEKEDQMTSFQSGTFANIYSMGAKKEVLDENRGNIVVKPVCNSQYYKDFVNLSKGLTDVNFMQGLDEKGGNAINLQSKVYTYNFDFNTQTFGKRQNNIDNMKYLYYGRYNHLLTAMEYTRQDQLTQYTINKKLYDRYKQLLEENDYSDSVIEMIQTEMDKAKEEYEKAETLREAVDKHIKDIKTLKGQFDQMVKGEQNILNGEKDKDIALCYRNNMKYKRTIQAVHTKDFLNPEEMLKMRKEFGDLFFLDEYMTNIHTTDQLANPTLKNSVQYTQKDNANIDYIVKLAKNRGIALDEYLESIFQVSGVVNSVKEADGIYKTGQNQRVENIDAVRNVTTFVDKTGKTMTSYNEIEFERVNTNILERFKNWGISLYKILTNDKNNNTNDNLRIKKVKENDKTLLVIQAAE